MLVAATACDCFGGKVESSKVNTISKVATCFSRRILVFSHSQPKVSKGTKNVLSDIKILEKGAEAFEVELQTLSTGTFSDQNYLL